MFQHRHHFPGTLGRILTGAALAVALSIASPAGAGAAGNTSPTGGWRWLEGLWADRMAAVAHNWTVPPAAASPSPGARAKDLVCPPTRCPTATGQQDQGPGIDPDGNKPH